MPLHEGRPKLWIVSLRVSCSHFLPLSAILLATAAAAQDRPVVRGVVHDVTGAIVRGADVQILAEQQRVAGAARTDDQGRFAIAVERAGTYLVEVRAAGFADVRAGVTVPLPEDEMLTLVTGSPVLREDVSVTARVDRVETATRLTQPVNIIGADDIQQRAKSVVAQLASEEAGLQLQQTSTVMAGIFVRGLTGNKVNVFVDGVRYSTSAQRGGVSTFLDLIDPALLDSVEVLRGPNSAQYGSDALGGSLQFLSRVPSVGVQNGQRWGGRFSASGNSSDHSVGSNITASYAGSRVGALFGLAGRRIGDLRTGGGVDSHAAVTRFLGVTSTALMPEHLPDTGFT